MKWQVAGFSLSRVARSAIWGGMAALGAFAVSSFNATVSAHATSIVNDAQVVSANSMLTETNKITLDETSIDGPALWTLANGTPQSSAPTTKAILAWTGTDPAHHLNVETSQDGLHYGNKIVLHETSDIRPSVLPVNPVGAVIIAWTGTDPNHLLNVLYDVYGSQQKITLDENSIGAPSLAAFKGWLWLSWTGTDAGHSLNILPFTIQSFSSGSQSGATVLVPGTKFILSQYSSDVGPSLVADTHGQGQLLLTWTYRNNDNAAPLHTNYAISSDGQMWHLPLVAPTPQTSALGPSMLATNDQPAAPYYWAWTGTNDVHSLNVTSTTTDAFPNWPAPITPLDEEALGGPALGYTNNGSQSILLAWTGTDVQHHLNIAEITA